MFWTLRSLSPNKPSTSFTGFPGGSEVKGPAWNVGDPGSIPGSGRYPGEGNGTPLQYSCLENPMDWGAWWATVHGVAKSQTRLSNFTSSFTSSGLVSLPFPFIFSFHFPSLFTIIFPFIVSVYNAGDLGSILGLGRSPGEGNGNPLQYYCLENPMDRGAW